MSAPGEETKTFKGTVSGEITHARQGTHGFGYDPIFFVPDKREQWQNLLTKKSEISHRGNAIQLLKASRRWSK